jgi:cellulose synthase/poly-beta-1,6-N-acetylglucosamine synthase-like glycosyltransferase
MHVYVVIASIAVAAQLLYLYYAARNCRYALAKYAGKRRATYNPSVALIVPCKGLDAHFDTNIRSLFAQNYNDYRLLFVVAETSDPAYDRLRCIADELRASSRALDIQILVAGSSTSCSQKIHNLLYAYDHIGEDTQVLAFADSDICVPGHWLERLVWPLRRPKCGAATGYRWFVPNRNNLASLVLSAVNSAIAQSLGNSRFNLAWGGSMAMHVQEFRRLGLPQLWQHTLSDDLSLSRAVKKARMKVTFVPGCLVPSYESMTWPQLYEFCRRQFLITRVYAPATWRLGLLISLGSVVGLCATTGMAIHAAATGVANAPLLIALAVLFYAGQLTRALLRHYTAVRALNDHRRQLMRIGVIDIVGSPIWSTLILILLLSSAFGRTICWRGIRYRLISSDRTEILGLPSPPGHKDAPQSGDPDTRQTP